MNILRNIMKVILVLRHNENESNFAHSKLQTHSKRNHKLWCSIYRKSVM